MKTLVTALTAALSASLIACGGGGDEPEQGAFVHCPQIFHAAYLVEADGTERLLTVPEQAALSDDELAQIGFFHASLIGLQGEVHVGDWCQDE